ncbi:MAG: substrate-binding domain-containing protein, partial [Verrucomicrobiota bacterium]
MKLFGSILTVVAGLFLVGCQDKEADTGEAVESKGRIGMTCMDLGNPFFQLIANEMEAAANAEGYELVALSGDNEPGLQNNQLSDFVAQGYDAIFLNPVDSVSAGQGVKKAHAAGIPVFTFDIQISDPEAKKLVTSHIGSDNYQGGRLAGKSMIEVLGNKGSVAVISLPEVSSCILRVQGFKDELKEAGSPIEIVTELSGKGRRDEGFKVATDILQAHPDINGIFAINDPSGLGAYSAVQKAEKTDQITIVAFDASPAGKQGVFDKKLHDTPQQFPKKMAHGTVAAFIKYMDGEEI